MQQYDTIWLKKQILTIVMERYFDKPNQGILMNEKPILDNDYADDLVAVREMLISEVEQIRKALSNEVTPTLGGVSVVGIMMAGVLLGSGLLILEIVAVLLFVAIIVMFVVGRYYLFARSCSSVLNHLQQGDPLLAPSNVKFLFRRTPIPTPENVYNAAWNGLDEEWQELRPLLESELNH